MSTRLTKPLLEAIAAALDSALANAPTTGSVFTDKPLGRFEPCLGYRINYADIESVRLKPFPTQNPTDLERDAICKLVKGDEWVTCGESVVAEYLAQDYVWDYQATAEHRSMSLALWRYWHDQQKERADKAEAELAQCQRARISKATA